MPIDAAYLRPPHQTIRLSSLAVIQRQCGEHLLIGPERPISTTMNENGSRVTSSARAPFRPPVATRHNLMTRASVWLSVTFWMRPSTREWSAVPTGVQVFDRCKVWESQPVPHDESPSAVAPPTALLQMMTGYWVSQALYVAAKLGVADFLVDGAQSVENLATQTDAHSLQRILRALASVGVFTEASPGVFALTPLAALLRSESQFNARLGYHVCRRTVPSLG